MKKVGLAAPIRNLEQFAEGFDTPKEWLDKLSPSALMQSIESNVRDVFKSKFSDASALPENVFDLESALAANDEVWDTPYYEEDGVDSEHLAEHHSSLTHNMPDLMNTAKTDDDLEEHAHLYAQKTLGSDPESDDTHGNPHTKYNEVNPGASFVRSQVQSQGKAIVQDQSNKNDIMFLLTRDDLRERERATTDAYLKNIREAREFLASMSEEDLDTNNTNAKSVEKRDKLRELLALNGMNLDDYIDENGIIDRERIDEELKAKDNAYTASGNENSQNAALLVQAQTTNIDASNLLGAPRPQHAFNKVCPGVEDDCDASYKIDERTPEDAEKAILASMGFGPASGSNSMKNDGFASISNIGVTNDRFASISDFASVDDGFASVPDDSFNTVTIDDNEYTSISVAEAVSLEDQPQEISLLPLGEWKNMAITDTFQAQSFATEATLAEAANQKDYTVKGGYGNTDNVAVLKIA